MQLSSADATILKKNLPLKTWKNRSQKLLIILPFFLVLPTGPKPAQISNIFNRNLPPRDFYIDFDSKQALEASA